MNKPTHAMVVPWPIGQGLRTWCGFAFDHPDLVEHNVASTPEAVTCVQCKQATKDALGELSAWVPRLT